MATISAAPQLASRLRLAVARTARRLRQEAGGGLSPTLTAALASIESHGPLTPSELADRERIKRPTATRLIGTLEEKRPRRPRVGPDRPALLADLHHARGA